MRVRNQKYYRERGPTPKGDCSTQPFPEATKSLAQDPRACSLHHQDGDLYYIAYFCNSLNNKLSLSNNFSYPLIKLFVCLNFQFATITKFILSEIRMSGEPPAHFDGLYKIAQVFGSVLEFNKPPNSVPLGNMTTFLGIMLLQQLESECQCCHLSSILLQLFLPPSGK